MKEKMLYHYCSTQKCFDILSNKCLRLSDIGKSSDYSELSLFFPDIFYEIENAFIYKPFEFHYESANGIEAMRHFLTRSYRYWDDKFVSGDFYNYVLCFSEKSDSLSQWRGYADDAHGCSLGFSKSALKNYCEKTKGVLEFVKIEYLVQAGIKRITRDSALEALDKLKKLRDFVVDNFTHDYFSPETDKMVQNFFNDELEIIFIKSLKYKSYDFYEEQEWRIFFNIIPFKNELKRETKDLYLGELFDKTIDFIQERVKFVCVADDLVSFCPIEFDEFVQSPIKELWLGPKNKARVNDVELFLMKHQYMKVDVLESKITYR